MKTRYLQLMTALVFALGLTPIRPAQAAGTVGTGTPESCSEAAFDAALAGGGTITFNCGGPATIVLTTQKVILVNTVIDGGGLITLSGNDTSRLFFVSGGYTFLARHITLTHGRSPVGGALVESAGAHLHFDDVRLSDSRAEAQGGAVYCFGGTDGTLTMTDTVVSGNHAGRGSGIYNDGCDTAISRSAFLNNTATITAATRLGGGLYAAGPVRITHSRFSGNSALDGGGLFVAAGYTVTVTGSTFANNTAGYGGAIENSGTLTVTASLLDRNTVAGSGGGLWNLNGSVWMSRSTLSGNSAGEGGALNSYGITVYLQDVNVLNNRATFTDGGGIYHGGGTLFVTNATVSDNIAERNGGGVYQNSDENLVLNSVTVSGNHALQLGGGLYHQRRYMVLHNVTLGDNDADVAGSAIYENAVVTVSEPGQIYAANVLIFGAANNCDGEMFFSVGHNVTTGACASLAQPSDQTVIDARIGPLAFNGGSFAMGTYLPLPGSPVTDAGDPGICGSYAVRDQRGGARVDLCDVGAVEFGSQVPMVWLAALLR